MAVIKTLVPSGWKGAEVVAKKTFGAPLLDMQGITLDAKTVSNIAVALAVMATLLRARAGWLTWFSLFVLALTMVPRLNQLSYNVMRWPLLVAVYLSVVVEMVLYVVLRVFVRMLEMAMETRTHRELRHALGRAEDYESWLSCARALDAWTGVALWQADLRSTRYNWPLVKGKITKLREGRLKRDWRAVVAALRLCTRPNVGGIMAPQLFSATHTGDPKTIVTDFVEEITASIQWLTKFALETHAALVQREELNDDDDNEGTDHRFSEVAVLRDDVHEHRFSEVAGTQSRVAFREESYSLLETAREFFVAAKESYGRTVLCLSGGGALGTYHFGVARALWCEDLLPDCVCGTSAGGIIASFICSRDDVELERDLMDDDALRRHLVAFDQSMIECVIQLYREGAMYDAKAFLEKVRWFANDCETGIRDMTFLEAYQRSGRHLAITACVKEGKRAPPVLLNHLTSPHVVIASAILATAGVPGLIKPTVLLEKDPDTGDVAPQTASETYIDGSIVTDIPTVALKEAFNARFIVASQVNPHIAPMLYHTHGSVGNPSRWFSPPTSEDAWRGGFVVAAAELFLKYDMVAKLQFLRDIDAAPGWSGRVLTQKFQGNVTITPSLHVRDYFEVFKNPTKHTLPRFLREGRVATYQKISMIRTRFAIERALAESCRALESALEAAQPASDNSSDGPYGTAAAFRKYHSGTEHHAWMHEVVQRRRTKSRMSQQPNGRLWSTPEKLSSFEDGVPFAQNSGLWM
ncbi:hypothetical protein CTAYLR_000891 [Chrysophaeum taylorii]|uniref:PNPLA domain-containing protein n=1 Tax=Chrysophaeum taylorii TaxID=2483200 RepID=A0AAD7UFC4_9STRA|nr:hypothetical protein CTAYLR_000891 [Chrysophaeum taylorii]